MTRYILYSKAIKSIKENHTMFICTTIIHILKLEKGVNVFELLPELLEYKPEPTRTRNCWWLSDEYGKNERLRVLTELRDRYENDDNEINITN